MDTDKTKLAIAAAIVFGVALLIGALFYASGRTATLQGPSKLARAGDGSVWVLSHGALHHFDAAGVRTASHSLAALGRSEVLAEMLPLRDGSMLLAEAMPSAVYRCDLKRKHCDPLNIAVPGGKRTAGVLTIAADEARGRLFIADNANHRLLMTDLDGRAIAVSSADLVLFPNEIALDAEGRLIVADTNHHRIARIGIQEDRFGPLDFEFSTSANKLYRSGRIWPNDFIRLPSGSWWVLNADNGMRNADLLEFDAEGKALRPIGLDPAADPTQLLLLDRYVLVADPSLMQLKAYGHDGTALGAWGDDVFQNELTARRAERKDWMRTRAGLQIALIALPFVGIVLLWRRGERFPRREVPPRFDPAIAARPVASGIHWLGVLPRFARSWRLAAWAVSLSMLALLAFSAWFVSQHIGHWNVFVKAMPLWTQYAVGALLGITVLAPLIWAIRPPRMWRQRIGTDGAQFFFDAGDGKVENYAFDALRCNGRAILAGKRFIKLVVPRGWLFDKTELQHYIFARIPVEAQASNGGLLWEGLRRGNAEIWFAVALVLFTLALLAAPQIFGWKTLKRSGPATAAASYIESARSPA